MNKKTLHYRLTRLLPTVTTALCISSFAYSETILPMLDCLIEPEMVADVSSPVDGTLEALMVDQTERVTKGQELARLESSVQQATLSLMSQQAQSTEEVELKKVALKFAKRKFKRYQDLHTRKAVSSFDKDQAETEVELAQLELAKSLSSQNKVMLEYERAKAAVALRKITSPINGVVIERHVMPGESVNRQPIMRIAQIDPLKVEVIVPDHFFGAIKPGMIAKVSASSPVSRSYSAKVLFVDKTIDAASGSFGVTLTLPNPDYQIPSGLKCQVQL